MIGEKTPTFAHECPKLDIPPWPELSVDKFWAMATGIIIVRERLPDEWIKNGGKRVDRDWFWKMLFAVNKNMVKDILDSCVKERNSRISSKI